MSHEKYVIDKLSQRLPNLLPDFVKEESPIFEQFLKAYFEYLEAEILVLKSQSAIDGIALEDGSGSVLLEPATVSPSPDQNTSKIKVEVSSTNINAAANPFEVGEYIYGETNGSVAKIEVISGNTLYIRSISGTGFSKLESVKGRDGNQTAIVQSYKQNTISANNRLLDIGDVDHTTEDFLEYYQRDFVPSLDLTNVPNKRLAIKHIKELYQTKGTEESAKFLMRILFGEDSEIRYPDNETIYLSDSSYNQQRRLVVQMDKDYLPKATDKITKYDVDGITILAESIVENVYVLDSSAYIYSCNIKNNHYGTFSNTDAVTFLDRDDKTKYTGVIKGIIAGTNLDNSSVYVEHDDDGVITLESGQPAVYSGTYDGTQSNLETTIGGGLTLETPTRGSMYSISDAINFTGAKDDTDVVNSKGVVDGLTYGPITHIYIEEEGTNYDSGDLVVFEDNLQSGGAEAIIGSVGDEILLENATYWGQFEVTATASQTVFSGLDNNGKRIFFNDNTVRVFVDGIESTPTTDFTTQNDRVTFTSPLSGGELVEIYTEFNRLVYENDALINQETTVGNIRSIRIKDGGWYSSVPNVYPGGYIYFDDITGFQEGEVVTGTNSSATATILRLEPKNKRIVVKRESTDTGVFIDGEQITGGTSSTQKLNTNTTVSSGTGAKLFAYGENIGGVASVNIQDQGYKFDSDGALDSSSFSPMLIETPTATLTRDITLTGDISGATATVVSYNANKHILTVKDVDGYFLENELVSYNNVDEFRVLKFDPYTGRGTQAGEGIMQTQFLGVRSFLDEDAANIHDGYYYQTHSYVLKVGESINKWRGALKDLLHPAGHIFFGEVAIKNVIDAQPTEQIRFRPTIIIGLEVVPYVVNAFTNSMREIEIYTNADEMNTPLIVLRDAGVPSIFRTTPYTEFGDSSHRNRHLNINIINSFASATTLTGTRLQGGDGTVTSLSLESADNGWLSIETERRPARNGKVFTSYDIVDEQLILEDGGLIELEEEVCALRMEPSKDARVKGDFGDIFILESGETLRLESATTDEPVHYFTTERSIELKDKYFLYEDGNRIVFEDGDAISDEDAGSHSYTSFVPLGSTYRTINTISSQQTYKISYYLRDETDEDGLLLEDGTGNVLSEESQPEGIRISDMEYYLPKMYVSELPLHERKRTNLSFNAYVKSA